MKPHRPSYRRQNILDLDDRMQQAVATALFESFWKRTWHKPFQPFEKRNVNTFTPIYTQKAL